MEKILGIVILYHPTLEVIDNIASYLPFIEKLYVMDNTEPASRIDLSILGDKICVIADGENKGISARLNQAAALAIQEDAKWLLTMDQDSFFENGMVECYFSCVEKYNDKRQVAMFGVEYEKKTVLTSNCNFKETDNLITSGSLVNLELFAKLKGFDENLFIDEVDAEYCFKANINGFKTLKVENVFLNHSLGTVFEHRSFKSFKKTPRTLHSPTRIYYMVRNYLYVADKYGKDLPESFPYRKSTILNRIKNNFLYGKERLRLLRYIALAYSHYKKRNMGKFNTP